MNTNIEEYTDEVFDRQLQRYIKELSAGLKPSLKRTAFLLGGQSGAGKTRLQKILQDKHGYNFIIINGDEYRSAHPHFYEIQERYGLDAPAHTAKWAGAMVEALIDAFSSEGYNLIIEGTLRTSTAPLNTANLLRNRGYDVSLALMAVKPEISLVSCQIRYEQMRIAGTTPRAVDPKHHKKIVDDIVSNLAMLELSGAFSNVSLYNRAGTCLFSIACTPDDAPASVVLQDVLFGDWAEEEREHYQSLQEQLANLKAQEAPIAPK